MKPYFILLLLLVGCTTKDICNINGITGMYECRSSTTNQEGFFKVTTSIDEYYIIEPGQTHRICYEGFEPVPEYCLMTCRGENLCKNQNRK